MPDPAHPEQTPQPAAHPLDALVKDGKILGKYETPEAAEKGLWELNRTSTANAQRVQELEQLLAGRTTQPAEPAKSAMDRLYEETAIPANLLRDAVNEIASQLVDQKFAPIIGSIEARQAIARELPEYLTVEPKVLEFLNGNPSVATEVAQLQAAGFAKQAIKVAYGEYLRANPSPAQADPQARAQGALPGGVSPQARVPEQTTQPGSFQDKVNYYRVHGDDRPALLDAMSSSKPMLPPEMGGGS